ncbi:MAG: hypothetical protein GY847_36305 [Proteobacteria bacterium]|nr:hypothetical protein [Pseudomonadota bacterium]
MKYLLSILTVTILNIGLQLPALAQQPTLEIKAKHPGEKEDKTLRVENIPVEGKKTKAESVVFQQPSPNPISSTRPALQHKSLSKEIDTNPDKPRASGMVSDSIVEKPLVIVLALVVLLLVVFLVWRRRRSS